MAEQRFYRLARTHLTNRLVNSMSKYECIKLETRGNTKIVKFVDERVMDPERIELLGKELLSLGIEEENTRVVLDFSHVRFFSSAAINKLIVMEKRLRARGGKVGLCQMNNAVRDLFGFTQLDIIFRIHESEQDAIDALQE